VKPLRLIFGGGAEEYEVLPREESLVLGRQVLERLYGAGDAVTGVPDVPPDRCDIHSRFAYGLCEECERKALARFRYGSYELCRACVRRRRNALRLSTEAKRAA
jgi:hypothetical protein